MLAPTRTPECTLPLRASVHDPYPSVRALLPPLTPQSLPSTVSHQASVRALRVGVATELMVPPPSP